VPRIADDGEEGEEREYVLELKLLADVGLVGLPNAGKSTLISAISAARPKVADYPFTTLAPNLGVVQYEDAPPFVVADIPGLIEGAHKGAGLGIRFLRHIERTRILVHLVDITQVPVEDPLRPYRLIEHELASYSDELCNKSRIVAINKVDMIHDEAVMEKVSQAYAQTGLPVVRISALRRQGLQDLLLLVARMLHPGENEELGITN
jgi:GTP-binding protein